MAACGEVEKVPDAAVPDAYAHDANELTCASGENACQGACTNLMTDELHCGACGTQCSPIQTCLGGTCVATNSSCNRVREIDPGAPDGVYVNPNTQMAFYCDFTNNRTYDGLAMGQHDATHAGFMRITLEELQAASFQDLFIKLYNRQGGLLLISTWSSSNCCFATGNATNMWRFGGVQMQPAIGGATQCNPTGGYTGSPFQIVRSSIQTPPLAEDYFITNPVTEGVVCSVSANPGFFWRVKNSLD